MNFEQIEKLKELLDAGKEDDDEPYQPPGGVFNPGQIGGGEKKEIAKPHTKIQTTVNNRDPKGGAKQTSDIWAPDEIKDIVVDKNETRIRPEFDIMFRQKVGTEDVYLGMSGVDPSSTKCQELLMKISLPGAKYKDVTLDVTEQVVCVQTAKYYLYHVLPYKVNEKEGKAQWISDKNILQLTLPIVREFDF